MSSKTKTEIRDGCEWKTNVKSCVNQSLVTAAGRAKQMLTLILLSGNKMSQPSGCVSNLGDSRLQHVWHFAVWSEAR